VQGFSRPSSGHLIAISRTELFRDCNRAVFDSGLHLDDHPGMKSPLLLLGPLAAAIILESSVKAGDYCPGFEVVSTAATLSRDPVNPYQFQLFEGFLLLGYCDSGCPTTNVILVGGSLVSCTMTPSVLDPNGGLLLIDCTVIQDPESDVGAFILDLPYASYHQRLYFSAASSADHRRRSSRCRDGPGR